MGRPVTYWNDDACIYNHEIDSKYQAETLLSDTKQAMRSIEDRIMSMIMDRSCIRSSEDEGISDYDLIHRILLDDEYSLFSEYRELSNQALFLSAIIDKFNSDPNFKPTTDWGHYGDFSLASAAE